MVCVNAPKCSLTLDTPASHRLPRPGSPECSRDTASDDYDRFGGRETPTVLRRNSLCGGGEHSKRAVEELRQQLEITEVSTVHTRALLDFKVSDTPTTSKQVRGSNRALRVHKDVHQNTVAFLRYSPTTSGRTGWPPSEGAGGRGLGSGDGRGEDVTQG